MNYKTERMTDKELIDGLINRDNRITDYFLDKYRPLFKNAIALIFDYRVDEDECINELYLYLMKNDAEKLKSFAGRSTFGYWLKRVVIRFFKDIKDTGKVIDNKSGEPLFDKTGIGDYSDRIAAIEAKEDLERLFMLMNNERYVTVLRNLVIGDSEPEKTAAAMGITVANLYNIKKRALASLVKVAIKQMNDNENK